MNTHGLMKEGNLDHYRRGMRLVTEWQYQRSIAEQNIRRTTSRVRERRLPQFYGYAMICYAVLCLCTAGLVQPGMWVVPSIAQHSARVGGAWHSTG